MAQHNEVTFEDEICQALAAQGWIYEPQRKAGELYDATRALIPEDVFGWLADTQPQQLVKVLKPADSPAEQEIAKKLLLDRLCKVLDKPATKEAGMLSVLRTGFKEVAAKFEMCQFKPAMGLNPETLERYGKVRLRVVRQVHYSTVDTKKSIDLVLFVNGLPVATIELKTDFTQNINDAVAQYRNDRLPRNAKNKDEPLLSFGRRALVHFAVSNDEIQMTTELKGKDTYFLPFNLGDDDHAGNPVNPKGSATSYLWERVLQRDSWLNIIGKFLHLQVSDKTNPVTGEREIRKSLLFPRYHQWDVVNQLIETARTEGPGHRYLIQHSAGSGKTNSIAWTAHQLSSLHGANNEKLFDSVIVVTDRTVLDSQLQDAIYQIEHKSGVVVPIRGNSGSKSAELTDALVARTPIIIVTIQTFPFALKAIAESRALKGRNFAIIADEAHSSQTGSTANKLKKVLSSEELADVNDGGEFDVEAFLAAEMAERADAKNISYFAFTATPKAKTLELFGRTGPDGLPQPFHLYSMQQAIEERFILDVLQNYTSYKVAYRLTHEGRDYDSEDAKVEKSEALKSLMGWVKLHPYNISQKVQVIVEHFRTNIAWRLDGKAKAMVVTGSRKEAVRYKLAIDKYIKDSGYSGLGTLVAFSGEVTDEDSGPEQFTETNMNPGLKGRTLPEAFSTEEYRIMLVANKFQTGFDQPLLVAMYVDKKLSGVSAVQTLSRVNRIAVGKDQTFVLDFVNNPDEILASFQPYFRKAALEGVSDPNVVHDLQAKLDAAQIYLESEVDGLVKAYVLEEGNNALSGWVAPAKSRFNTRYNAAVAAADKTAQDELDLFRKDLGSFVRAYDFLSQIFDFADTDLEKRSIYYKHLLPVLRVNDAKVALDLSGVVLAKYALKDKGKAQLQLTGEDAPLKPPTEVGTGQAKDPVLVTWEEIIQQANLPFEGEEMDAVAHFVEGVRRELVKNETLQKQAQNNSRSHFGSSPHLAQAVTDAVSNSMASHYNLSLQALGDTTKMTALLKMLSELVYEEMQL
ncbi:type I restriction endonuclease subunit R [Paeniglutamicibacter gangotriensis]|uniref:Type I restriction endonuclease subunit R n=1 Tax=Paeniglutamicibacter gangotriensis TaxID=254787 RepID=A0A5B0E2X6_9MICC|nr:type I restriction endonuclease [Paeniglutamicibacter gangotriensis]KAA0973018.1 type I restriction endonuclease subunit R [Paeniglutamicibacter gangotriensis]